MAQRQLVGLLESMLVSVLVGARPAVAGDGVDITPWRTNGDFSSPLAALFLDGSQAQTVNGVGGSGLGAELWGFRLNQWWLIGYLNNGADIAIAGAAQGFAQEIDIIGIFERLAVAGTVSAGNCTAKLAPINVWNAT